MKHVGTVSVSVCGCVMLSESEDHTQDISWFETIHVCYFHFFFLKAFIALVFGLHIMSFWLSFTDLPDIITAKLFTSKYVVEADIILYINEW